MSGCSSPPVGPKVLYLIDSLAPGGAERSLADLVPYLTYEGVQLEVGTLHDRPGLAPELRQHGITVHTIGSGSRAVWLWGVLRLIGTVRPDVVHTTLFESDVVGRTAAALKRVPVVTTLANTPYGSEHAGEPGVGRTRLRAAQAVDIVTSRLAAGFHAVSQATADACIDRLRLDPGKVEVIPRGRDLSRLGTRTEHRRSAVRARLGVADRPMVLAVGRQEPQKGFEVLLRSWPTVTATEPEALLVVAGREGRASEALRQSVRDLSLTNSVIFLGERSDVPDLMVAADVFALPSYREGLPGVVLEAMALELPIIASDLPTVREAVPDERYARLVPVGDHDAYANALVTLLRDRSAAARLAAEAKSRFVARFDITMVARLMAGFYRSTLEVRQ